MRAFYVAIAILITAMVFSESRKYGGLVLIIVVLGMLIVFKRKGGNLDVRNG